LGAHRCLDREAMAAQRRRGDPRLQRRERLLAREL